MVASLFRVQQKANEKWHTSFFVTREEIWSFSSYITQQPASFYETLIKEHFTFGIEYAAHRAQLKKLFKQNSSLDEKITHIQALLVMAECQEVLFRDYLTVPREAARFRQDAYVYRVWLKSHGYVFPDRRPLSEEEQAAYEGSGWSRYIRDSIAFSNPWRLLFLRTRRFLLCMIPLLHAQPLYGIWMRYLDLYLVQLAMLQAWVFFIPRLVTNSALLLKHVCFPDELEKSLSVQCRLWGQLDRRWAELINDILWCGNGLLAYFVLTGAWSYLAIYFSVALQASDLFFSSLRTMIELGRLEGRIAEYEALIADPQTSLEMKSELEHYLLELNQQVAFLRHTRFWDFVNFSILFLGICTFLPVITNPFIPAIGSALMVVMTCWRMDLQHKVSQQRPDDRINHLLTKQFSFKKEEALCNPLVLAACREQYIIIDTQVYYVSLEAKAELVRLHSSQAFLSELTTLGLRDHTGCLSVSCDQATVLIQKHQTPPPVALEEVLQSKRDPATPKAGLPARRRGLHLSASAPQIGPSVSATEPFSLGNRFS